jgi:mono/diheme cytochrome c family protein
MPRSVLLPLACLALVAPALSGQDSARVAAAGPADTVGIYSSQQARRGQSTYEKRCVNCHSATAYTGAAFRMAWGNRSAYELWEQIRTSMPQDSPGSLSPREYADIVAYLLKLNKLPAGPSDLPSEAEQLKPLTIRVPGPGR